MEHRPLALDYMQVAQGFVMGKQDVAIIPIPVLGSQTKVHVKEYLVLGFLVIAVAIIPPQTHVHLKLIKQIAPTLVAVLIRLAIVLGQAELMRQLA